MVSDNLLEKKVPFLSKDRSRKILKINLKKLPVIPSTFKDLPMEILILKDKTSFWEQKSKKNQWEPHKEKILFFRLKKKFRQGNSLEELFIMFLS